MKMSKRTTVLFGLLIAGGLVAGCSTQTSGIGQQQAAQSQIEVQSNAAVGMPAITNFTEKKDLKMIYELRDKANLVTYMYTQALNGKWVYQGQAVGFPIPYSTEYTNPMMYDSNASNGNYAVILPQADPNGLYSSQNTQADWIMREGPHGLYPAYIEPNVYVTPVKIAANLCESWSLPKGY